MGNQYDLLGQHAIVTGGAQGIGRGIAERLLAGGAAVALWDKDEALARESAQALSAIGQAIAVEVDVTELSAVEAAFAETLKAFGSVQVLVNNAGISGPVMSTWEYPPDAWHQVFKINLDGPFFCCRTVIPHMIARNYGRIVNIASVAGKEGNPKAPAYSASKAGVIGLTKTLGKELAEHDISVNCIAPAAAKTAIFDQMSDEHIEYMLSKIPRKRFARVEEIASMVAFAASPDCSFTTGSVFDVTGGRSTY